MDNATASESADRVERFFARELGCPPELLRQEGVHLLASPRRERPLWCGFQVPLLLLNRNGSTVVSVASELLSEVQGVLDGTSGDLTDETVSAMQDVAGAEFPDINRLWGHALYCEPDQFQPVPCAGTEELVPDAPEWEVFQDHFDGPVFVHRASNGDVASWAALKLKGDEVWEVSVVTNPRYRGRGLAKVVVSAATAYILEEGRVPLYVYDKGNEPSARVAGALGYREFGREAICSRSRTNPTGMW